MLHTTQAIVIRSVKYGETSLITTLFTEKMGVVAYMVQGIRSSSKAKKTSRAGLLQPSTMLNIIAEHKPQKTLHHLKEFSPAYYYLHLQEDIVRNSIAQFSIELLLRLLPEAAPLPELFAYTYSYFRQLDTLPTAAITNFPILFLINCGRYLGYDMQGSFSSETPYANLIEGAFTANPPAEQSPLSDIDSEVLSKFLYADNPDQVATIQISSASRNRIIEWLIAFLHTHTQHMGPIKSLPVLQTILH